MFGRKLIAAGLVALGVAAALPAQAQDVGLSWTGSGPASVVEIGHRWGHEPHYDGHWRESLSPQEVRWILRREGFRRIQYVDRQGRTYAAEAVDYRGRPVIVRVSARSGQILSVRPIYYGHDRPRCWLPEGCGY